MKRKPISKTIRQQVYDKYNGHCAYCGKEIELKDMQVDHIVPIFLADYSTRDDVKRVVEEGKINVIDNYMPACRSCNFYKGVCDIDGFRERIKNELDHTCRQSFQTRLAMQYGIIKYEPWDGKFYFERK